MSAVDDSGGPEEFAEIRRLFGDPRTSARLLRVVLIVAWFDRRLLRRSEYRRDEGLNQRINLIRMLVKEKTGR